MAQERIHAPELEGGVGWLNTDRPLTLAELRGKIVLLDFWTYCCINCMHVLLELKRLEQRYADQLIVIGVHSAKFPNEGETDNIRKAILRYEIQHPVVNDRDFQIWQRYGPRAWPTLILIDPEGYIVGGISGEGHYSTLDRVISEVIVEHRKRRTLSEEPLSLALEDGEYSSQALSFPGKILADSDQNRLFIADSNHNRIVVTTKNGKLLDVAGSGSVGSTNGSFETAAFNHPQGMALGGDLLYVADTENHLIRCLDLRKRTVSTLAGNGELALGSYQHGPAKEVALGSPWDLQIENGSLYIAMAGPHQIWALDFSSNEIGPHAGSSREARVDGPLEEAALAQPSGLTSDGNNLFVADSEVSAIRSVSLTSNGRVDTVVGVDLFEFGDRDGQGSDVRLQHPLGIVHHNGVLYVADTYNHKIKTIGPALQTSCTLFGSGKPGQTDGPEAEFYEPGGVSIADGKLYIADTNNHAIRVADLETETVSTLEITGLTAGQSNAAVWPNLDSIEVPAQTFKPGTTKCIVNVAMPTWVKLNPSSPLECQIEIDGCKIQEGPSESPPLQFPLSVQTPIPPGSKEIRVRVNFVYCYSEGEAEQAGVCMIKSVEWIIPIQVDTDGAETVCMDYALTPELPERVEMI